MNLAHIRRSPNKLLNACQLGDVNAVAELLKLPRIRVNAKSEGFTPFFLACYLSNVEVVKMLLADGRADVNEVSDEGVTPFYAACEAGLTEIVRLLLADKRVIIDWAEGPEQTPLHAACFKNRASVIKLLLADPRVDVNDECSSGRTPLYFACLKDSARSVALLLADARVNVNKAYRGETPFYIACEMGASDTVIGLLLKNEKVDVNKPDRNRCHTPLWILAENGHLRIIKIILTSYKHVDTKARSVRDKFHGVKTAAELARSESNRPIDYYSNDFEVNGRRAVKNGKAIADLIDAYEQNPRAVRLQLRRGAGLIPKDVAAVFALVVFLCEGLLKLKRRTPQKGNLARFFSILQRLPMELQMLTCNRAFESMKDSVLTKVSEPSFKKLAKVFS